MRYGLFMSNSPLVRGCFPEFSRTPREGRFAYLRKGQMRCPDNVAHNGGWYNKEGEKIGWGDLSFVDAVKVAQELDEGEMFIVMLEHDSFWRFARQIMFIGAECKTAPTAEAPGKEYVALHARWVFEKNRITYVTNKENVSELHAWMLKHMPKPSRVDDPTLTFESKLAFFQRLVGRMPAGKELELTTREY